MKRFHRGDFNNGGLSKATSSTLCQKCLKKGHYSFECKAAAQERPYVSRPSRTQQLLNPKLIPKLSDDIPQDLLRKKGIADEQLAKFEEERRLNRNRQNNKFFKESESKRVPITSTSTSVSTISDHSSLSPEPDHKKVIALKNGHSCGKYRSSRIEKPSDYHRERNPSEKRKKRESSSGSDSSSSDSDQSLKRRSTKRSRSTSPPIQRKNYESKSSLTLKNYDGANDQHNSKYVPRYSNIQPAGSAKTLTKRKKSLSPFSRRLALTQAMNMNR